MGVPATNLAYPRDLPQLLLGTKRHHLLSGILVLCLRHDLVHSARTMCLKFAIPSALAYIRDLKNHLYSSSVVVKRKKVDTQNAEHTHVYEDKDKSVKGKI